GTIELTSVNCGYQASLTVNNGTLVNAAGGSIKALTGVGGARYLYAQLDNQGTMDITAPFSIIRAAAVHLNSGTTNINNNGGLTINQSGSASAMTNSGTIHLDGGDFAYKQPADGDYTSTGTNPRQSGRVVRRNGET